MQMVILPFQDCSSSYVDKDMRFRANQDFLRACRGHAQAGNECTTPLCPA